MDESYEGFNRDITDLIDVDERTHASMVAELHATYGMMSQLQPGERFNKKVAPAYDGRISFWRYEQDVRDWQILTETPAAKQGVELRHRLCGECDHW